MVKVLVADDESRIRGLVQDALSSQGYATVAAADGKEALEAFEEHQDIALVILDVMMPKYDGWTVCREIRKMSGVPILMLTARTEEFDQLHGFESRLTTDIYPAVAKLYETRATLVEHAMRNAIEIAWTRGNINVIFEYFGYTVNDHKGKPSNLEFVAMIAERMRMQFRCARER